MLLLLFNKTIKPLNQYAKKIQKKSLFWGLLLTIFFTTFDKIFPKIFFSVTHKFLCEVLEKGTTHFEFIQQAIERNGSNIYREKLIM